MKIRMATIQPEPFVTRMGTYMAEMFPLHERIPAAFLLFISFSVVLQVLNGWTPVILSVSTLVGGLTVLLLLFLLRLMDEIKDKDVDTMLFPERPMPSGRVKESDIRFTMLGTILAFLVLHAWIGSTWWMAVAVLAYTGLMYRFFFVPHLLKNSLPLTLLTHNPVIPLMLALLVGVTLSGEGETVEGLRWARTSLLVLQFWAMSFSWEIARKIRSTEEETSYVTYSRLFGIRGAVAVAAAGQLISAGIGMAFVLTCGLSGAYLAVLLCGLAVPLIGYVRFVSGPGPRTSRLRVHAEVFMFAVMLAGVVEYVVRTLTVGN